MEERNNREIKAYGRKKTMIRLHATAGVRRWRAGGPSVRSAVMWRFRARREVLSLVIHLGMWHRCSNPSSVCASVSFCDCQSVRRGINNYRVCVGRARVEVCERSAHRSPYSSRPRSHAPFSVPVASRLIPRVGKSDGLGELLASTKWGTRHVTEQCIVSINRQHVAESRRRTGASQ